MNKKYFLAENVGRTSLSPKAPFAANALGRAISQKRGRKEEYFPPPFPFLGGRRKMAWLIAGEKVVGGGRKNRGGGEGKWRYVRSPPLFTPQRGFFWGLVGNAGMRGISVTEEGRVSWKCCFHKILNRNRKKEDSKLTRENWKWLRGIYPETFKNICLFLVGNVGQSRLNKR